MIMPVVLFWCLGPFGFILMPIVYLYAGYLSFSA